MEKKENITKILLLGETGVGKSSLANYIFGEEKFKTGGTGKSVTNKIEGEISERELYKDIYVIDTPGTQDSQKEDSKFLEKIKNNFKDKNCGIRAICLLLNFTQPRFTVYLKKQIKIYCLSFPIEDFWDHVCIIFSKAFYYIPENHFISQKKDLESDQGLINQIMIYIKECTETINDSKKNEKNFKKIKIISQLPVFYIDSYLKVEANKNMRSQKEMGKLINWARNKGYIDYQNINKNKIDINYISSERIEDIILNDEKFLGDSKLKIYSKKYYAQYKKITFHKELINIKDPEPYKIEEIKEEEMKSPPILISSPEINDYKIYKIEIKAVKAKKRIIENNYTGEWMNIENPEKLGGSRIISTKKIEEKIENSKELNNIELKNGKTIEYYNHFKITKIFVDGIEQKSEEKKENLYKEKKTIEIEVKTTEKKEYINEIKYCEDIIIEKTLIEFDNGKEPIIKIKEKNRKTRYFKIFQFEGDSFQEENESLITTKVKKYEREDEIDSKGNIISRGKVRQIGERISTKEKDHIIDTNAKKNDYQPIRIVNNSESDPCNSKTSNFFGALMALFFLMFFIGIILNDIGVENKFIIILISVGIAGDFLLFIIFGLYYLCKFLCCC